MGKRSPTFARRTLGGDSVAVPTHKPVTVVFFFATWSEPDKVLATRIRELAHIYPDLAIVGVGLDDEDRSLRAMARAYGITYPIVWDEGHVLANAYHIETDPQTFVLDAEGKVLLIQFGYRRDDDAVLEAEIASRLKTDICERPLAIEDGPACFRHCSSIATAEKRCTTPDCHARCSARACRETCGSDNERRKAALEFCRRTRPRARDACEAACHAEAMNDAITACDYHSAGQSTDRKSVV